MWRVGLAGVVAMALWSAPAHATVIESDGSQRYRAWADASKVAVPSVPISVHETADTSCGRAACAFPGAPVRPGQFFIEFDPRNADRHDFLHELGHIVDYAATSDTHRTRFLRIFSLDRAWIGGGNEPAEQWAEGWSYCAEGHTRRVREGGYGFKATASQLKRLCATANAASGI